MASTITADNGVVSGSAGIKSSADSSGVLALASGTGTTAVTIDTSQNVGIGTSSPSGAKVQIVGDNSALRVGDGTRDMYVDPDSGGIFLSNGSGQSGEGFYLASTGNSLRMFTASTERARIDSSGNVGIGVTPVAGAGKLQLGATEIIGFQAASGGNIASNLYYASGWKYITTGTATLYSQSSGGHYWSCVGSGSANATATFGTQMALDPSGNLLVGTTTAADNSGVGVKVFPSYAGSGAPEVACVSSTSSTSFGTWYMYSTADSQYKFYVNYAGTVFARSTSITGLSDISEKENIRPLETGLPEVMRLQPRRFDWKSGGGSNVAGFIAQEVEAILPDLVEQYKSGDEATKLGLKMGDMIPTLVKAIQEQQALINNLTERLAALEAK